MSDELKKIEAQQWNTLKQAIENRRRVRISYAPLSHDDMPQPDFMASPHILGNYGENKLKKCLVLVHPEDDDVIGGRWRCISLHRIRTVEIDEGGEWRSPGDFMIQNHDLSCITDIEVSHDPFPSTT